MNRKKANKAKKETKNKGVTKREKRRNDTRHERAMESPEVLAAVNALKSNRNSLSQLQRGKLLQRLIDFGCSRRGLERDLKVSATTIRRAIDESNSTDEGGDLSAVIGPTLARTPDRQKEINSIQAARESKAMFEKNRPATRVVQESHKEKPSEHPLQGQQSEKGALTSSTGTEGPMAASAATVKQLDQAEAATPKMSLLEYRDSIMKGKLKRIQDILG